MKYIEMKKRAFMSIVNKVKGFLRTVSGTPPLALPDCVDVDSIVSYTLSGASYQDGTPTPEEPIEVESVGDKTENLMVYPYIDTTNEAYGITFTDNGDGTIIVNGTIDNTASVVRTFKFMEFKGLTDTTKKYYLTMWSFGNASTNVQIALDFYYKGALQSQVFYRSQRVRIELSAYNFNFDQINFSIMIHKNETFNNLILKPMLVEGDTPKEFEPYNKYKIPVKASGKNLFDINGLESKTDFVIENNTLTITRDAGSSTAYIRSNITPEMFLEITGLKAGEQIITALNREVTNGTPTNSTGRMQFNGRNGVATWNLTNDGSAKTTTVPENFNSDNYATLVFYGCSNGESGKVVTKLSNIIIARQEVYDGKYESYVEPVITNIYLDEPLSKFDYIDFENQKLIKSIISKKMNSVWGGTGVNGGPVVNTYPFYARYSDMKASIDDNKVQIISTGLKGVGHDYFCNTDEECISINNNLITLRLNKEKIGGATKDLANAYLAEYPLTIYYALATPTETDIVLPKLPTFKGTTVYSVDTKINPSNMSATYYSSMKGE